MPYYVYQLESFGVMRKVAEFDTFKSASNQAKALRAAATGPGEKYKLMFAENELQAEDLLSQVRTAGPAGDE